MTTRIHLKTCQDPSEAPHEPNTPYPPARSAKLHTEEPERLGNLLDMLDHASNVQIDAITTAKIIKLIGAESWRIGEVDGLKSVADVSTIRTNVQSNEDDQKKAKTQVETLEHVNL